MNLVTPHYKHILLGLSLAYLIMIFNTLNINAQNNVVKGIVLNAQTKAPIPYAHVYINSQIGTITNLDGLFELKIPLEIEDSVLVQFSSVGFNTLFLNIDLTQNAPLTVSLTLGINMLEEVVITASDNIDSAYWIMENVIANIRKNYPKKKFGMEAFYREANISDTSYSRLIEAQLYIASKGYDSPIEKEELRVLQLRKTEDNRDIGWRQSLFEWLYSINGAFKTLANDRLKLSSKLYNSTEFIENQAAWIQYERNGHQGSIRFMSQEFINGCDLKINDIVKTDKDTTFAIEYIVRKQVMKRQGRGVIYINMADWAIVEIHAEVVKPDTTKYYQLDYTLRNSRAYYQTIIKYQKHNDKYYLSYIKSNSIGTNSMSLIGGRDRKLFSESKGKRGTIYQENELYITSIIPYRKIKKKNRLDKEDDLYDVDVANDSAFWATYNYPLLNPLTDKMRNDLKTLNNEIFIK